MTALSLMARFPLGVYYGHRADKSVDFSPSPARLHSALLNAAAQGSTSDNGQPTPKSLAALEWLEQNPPDGLFQPETFLTGDSSSRFIYRTVSSINKKRRTEQRRVSDGVAVADGFGYRWENAPEDVTGTIIALAEDVACLGEAHSIVVIEPADFSPNLELDPTASAFTPGGVPREVAQPGRTDELLQAFQAVNAPKAPSAAADKFTRSEEPRPSPVPRHRVSTTMYRSAEQEKEISSPWTAGYFFELDKSVRLEHRVELCTAMHRALVSQVGFDVSPAITGKYLDATVDRPANRLAIQYLPASWAQQFGLDNDALVLFTPQGLTADDVEQISQARNITKLWGRRFGKISIRYSGFSRHGDDFWPAPQPGLRRFWRPLTPVIPETRRVKNNGVEWTLVDSGLLSLAYVWRDDMTVTQSGQRRYLELRDQAANKGAEVHSPVLHTKRAANYVHRTHRSVPVQPYNALFDLGELANDTTAVMVGQSRHLGGGFLAPFDVAVDDVAAPFSHAEGEML